MTTFFKTKFRAVLIKYEKNSRNNYNDFKKKAAQFSLRPSP